MLVRALDEAMAAADWTPLIDGAARSAWVDGLPAGARPVGDGTAITWPRSSISRAVRRAPSCAASDLATVTADRPWGANNPRWTRTRTARSASLLAPGAIDAPHYVVVLAGNGPSAALLALRAEAFGPRGAHAVVETTVGQRITMRAPGKAL